MKKYYVYILFSKRNGTLYVGVTNDLIRRVKEHKEKIIEGFTQKYQVDKLGYFEEFPNVEFAIEREKQIKGKKRQYKVDLIESKNPDWKDLFAEIIA